MKERRIRRWLSLLLTVVMVLSLFPTTVAYAAETEDEAPADNAGVEVVDVAEGIPADLDDTAKEMLEDMAEESGEVSGVDEAADAEETTGAAAEPAEEPAAADEVLDAAEDAEVYAETVDFEYTIFHLDCGRKYFTVAQVKTLIDALAENGYTHMELAFGNDGLRFLLDDMSVDSYTSDAVKAGIQAGNKAYYNAGTYNEWTQSEMDEIIAYAKSKGVGIIPLMNTPGHMDAILDCMESVGISNPAYSNSARTVDVTNTAAVDFTLALVNKYITYFAGKGCEFFNMGCDEYANDVSNSGFAGLISNDEYGSFVTYVNNMAAQVKDAGMTPMAFNDGIYYNSNTSSGTFDTKIAIAYWTSGWDGYSPASASFLAGKGHKIISTNDAWYYVLGRQAGDSRGYTIATAQDGVKNTKCTNVPGGNDPDAIGCMVCLWCDSPSASYSETEVNNVTGLISTFAASNPDYFAASGESEEPGESTDVTEKTITVTVGQTATDKIEGADYSKDIDEAELDKTIATVSAEYKQETGGTKEVKATSITSGSSYYIKNSSGQYLNSDAEWVSDNSSDALWTATSSGSGYTLKNGRNYLRDRFGSLNTTTKSQNATTWSFSNGTFSYSGILISYTLGDAYTVSTKEPVDATTVTFTGVAVGTTHVTVGNIRYTIIVNDKAPDGVLTSDTLSIVYRITNSTVYVSQSTSSESSATISSSDAAGEEGIAVIDMVPETAYSNYDGWLELHYWQAMRLDSDHHQSGTGSGDDQTSVGTTFTHVRYHNSAWQYMTTDGIWHYFLSGDQAVAYYMRHTKITTEITTAMKDWGYSTDSTTPDTSSQKGQVALTVAVVYPDGTVSPAERNMYAKSTTIFNYNSDWQSSGKARDIGLIVPLNNSDYTISKITVTDGVRTDNTSSNTWSSNATISWNKVTNEAGSEWYDEKTYWDESQGGTPMINGATQDIRWSAKNTAKLVLIYLKPVHYDTNLIVNWVDDSNGGSLISTMEVAVSSDGTPTTFYNGLTQKSVLPAEGVGGTFTLDDNAYIVNSSNVNQTFNKDISTVPGVADQYKTGLYQYVSAELSADGKTMTLHYNIDSSKLSLNYVVDFGLPVRIPLSEIAKNTSADKFTISGTSMTYGTAAIENDYLVYTPERVLQSTDVISLKVSGIDEKIRIGIIPASNVLYEDKFLTENKTIGTDAKYKTWVNTGMVSGTQSSDQELRYGYDAAYAGSTGDSMSARWTVGVPASGDASQYLTTTFTGTGFDLIGTSGPNTGYVYLSIKGNGVNKLIIIDTSYGRDTAADTLYQVPLAHVQGLPQGTYEVNIRAAYRATNEHHPVEGTTVTIDGFRVYRSTDDEAYQKKNTESETRLAPEGEYGAVYHNILSAIEYKNGKAAFTEFEAARELMSRADYEANGGPQNEVYLGKDQAVVLDTNLIEGDKVQVSARAVTGTAAKLNNNQAITSNTEMYYEVTVGDGGVVVLSNTGEGLLALGNLKVLGSAGTATVATFALEEVTDDTLRTASAMMVDYSAAPEEAETFSPEKLKVNVKRNNGKHSKQVTVTVTASADVAKLTINGETVNPSKTRKGKRGEVSEYTYVFTDTVKRGETKSYDIIAYNADGVASKATTVTG